MQVSKTVGAQNRTPARCFRCQKFIVGTKFQHENTLSDAIPDEEKFECSCCLVTHLSEQTHKASELYNSLHNKHEDLKRQLQTQQLEYETAKEKLEQSLATSEAKLKETNDELCKVKDQALQLKEKNLSFVRAHNRSTLLKLKQMQVNDATGQQNSTPAKRGPGGKKKQETGPMAYRTMASPQRTIR
jgi:hypothetical protein